jgi:integrase
MANTSSLRVPKYRRHKPTGQAVVTLSGRDLYLGKYGTAASKQAYQRVTAEWLQAGGNLSAQQDGITVVEIIAAYMRFARTYYVKDGKPTNEVKTVSRALLVVKELYGRESAVKFGPLALKTVREAMIEKDWCRKQINKQIDRVKRVFKWAVSEEMLPGSVYEALRTVTGLRKGRSKARESLPVQPVDAATVDATLEKLPEVVADMVQVQRFTGARPGEVCNLRPGDINRDGNVWEYIPQSHKTEHHDQPRVVFVGPRAQEILLKYLLRPVDAYCFSPIESEAQRREQQHRQRTTPMSCGNRPGNNRRRNPRRKAGDKYSTTSYGRAITRAAEAAGVSNWSPHRLRHSFATEVRKSHGLEAVQVSLGHSKAAVTEIYAERNFALAARVAAEVG